jgi:threonylcarbamoyladenosine tRNA methylthiotransferase MtaB
MLIQNKTFCIKNLGCRTNICETNVIFDQLIKNKAINVKNFNDANICIINSCCVTNKAEQKTYLFINQAIRSSKCELIAVIGCLPQIGKLKLVHHKIGIVIGNKHKTSLISYIKKYQSKQIYNVEKFNKSDEFEKFGNFHHGSTTRAFIKIQEGCNFMCSYCIIPFARGRQHSLSHVNVLKLINLFVKNGFQEIVLVGVNTAGYKEGTKYFFIDLLKDINKMPGNFRIRISSLEPFQMNKAIVDLITSNHQRWCQHFHICLQSGADITIKNMQRKYTIQKFFKLCKYIRFKNPLASITTDCIVGFPTETSKDFNESY